ncbi:Glycoside hydrolase [Pleurostoma richardsiae]|uniref:Glycoside hydrolase n=1 Tax=Pleurostoma richardsiae TaxID=41990 RepID=A0AA38R4H3_9PEZI|nr:Glycoside hydrolase [Pleurostoma richardsiae]
MAFMKFIHAAAFLAATVAANPLPAPPSATEAPTATLKELPFFGHIAGNFQPSSNFPTNATKTKRETGEWVQLSADARWDQSNIQDGVGDGSDSYTMYWGSGGSWDGWPTRSQWVSFENMFNNNKNFMFSSCSQWGVDNDSGPEVGAIWDSIQEVGAETGVDHRFILAVILQESGGCVRAPTSNYGVRNPGLMQDHDGDATCNSDITGVVQNPCPTATVEQMIREGTAGTNSGDGLANCINQAGWSDDADFYRAARIYNSGSVDSSGRLEAGIATHCYASDIANRLTGWVYASHGCTCDDNPSSCGI